MIKISFLLLLNSFFCSFSPLYAADEQTEVENSSAQTRAISTMAANSAAESDIGTISDSTRPLVLTNKEQSAEAWWHDYMVTNESNEVSIEHLVPVNPKAANWFLISRGGKKSSSVAETLENADYHRAYQSVKHFFDTPGVEEVRVNGFVITKLACK